MLTQEQSDKMSAALNQLEAAQLSYNDLQKKLDSYDKIINEVSANYNSYSPEKKAQIDSLLPQLSEQYALVKKQKQDQYLAQYDAQQTIDYYNQLDLQQSAPANSAGQRRRTVVIDSPEIPTYENPIKNTITQGDDYSWTSGTDYWPGSWGQNRRINYSFPGWVSTINGPRSVGGRQNANTNVQPGQYMTPITEMVGGMSTAGRPRVGYIGSNTNSTQYTTPATDATLPGRISTTEGPRYVGGR